MFRSIVLALMVAGVVTAGKNDLNGLMDDYLIFLSKHDTTAFHEFSKSQLAPVNGSLTYNQVTYSDVDFTVGQEIQTKTDFIEESTFRKEEDGEDTMTFTGTFFYPSITFSIGQWNMPNMEMRNVQFAVGDLSVPLNLTIAAKGMTECTGHFTRTALLLGKVTMIAPGTPFDKLDITEFFNSTYFAALNDHLQDITVNSTTCEPLGIIAQVLQKAIEANGLTTHKVTPMEETFKNMATYRIFNGRQS